MWWIKHRGPWWTPARPHTDYRTSEETRDELQKGMEVAIQSTMETFKEEVSKITEAAALVSSGSPETGTHPQGSMV